MTRLSTTQARAQMSEVIGKVAHAKETVCVTKNGKDVAAIIPMESYKFLTRALAEAEEREDREAIRRAWKAQGNKRLRTLAQVKRDLEL